MSKVVGLSSKKSRWLLQSLRDQQRHSLGTGFESANILLSPKYHLKDKDLRKIHKAARVGDAARVQQLLLGKCGVNDKDKKKRTALHIACAYGHPKVVMALIEGRCEINATDSEECTSLVKAVQCQEEECATILLENGADPNIVDAQGNSALHYAVYYKNTSLAAKLLDHEVNIEATNKVEILHQRGVNQSTIVAKCVENPGLQSTGTIFCPHLTPLPEQGLTSSLKLTVVLNLAGGGGGEVSRGGRETETDTQKETERNRDMRETHREILRALDWPGRTTLQQDPSAHVYWESLIVEAKRLRAQNWCCFYRPRRGVSHTRIGYALSLICMFLI